jgi:hypothetical protein
MEASPATEQEAPEAAAPPEEPPKKPPAAEPLRRAHSAGGLKEPPPSPAAGGAGDREAVWVPDHLAPPFHEVEVSNKHAWQQFPCMSTLGLTECGA